MVAEPKSFYWYDLETSGLKSSWDRIIQFAGQRTDANLNPIGNPVNLLIKLPPQVLPDPVATLVTKLTPAKYQSEGIREWEAINQIWQELSRPGTCVLGFNSIAFDDEFIRYAFYRNFLPVYEREHKAGNSRFDLMRVVHTIGAFRPECLEWEIDQERGGRKYSLASIAKANGIDASQAHDAMADVDMSIAIAKKVKERESKLWSYLLKHRTKNEVQKVIQGDSKHLLHVANYFGKERCYTTAVRVLATNPVQKNQILLVDLSSDLDLVVNGTPKEIVDARFRSREEVDESGADRLELYTTQVNQCPVFVAANGIPQDLAERCQINLDKVEQNSELFNRQDEKTLTQKMNEVFKLSQREFDPREDPVEQLYDEFIPDHDVPLLAQISSAVRAGSPWPAVTLKDQRLQRLEKRLRFELRPEEMVNSTNAFEQYVRTSLQREEIGLESKRKTLKEVRDKELSDEDRDVLDELESYYNDLATRFEI